MNGRAGSKQVVSLCVEVLTLGSPGFKPASFVTLGS